MDDVPHGRPQGLRIDGVTVRFGATTAVDDVTLDVPAGSVLAVLGPSGCGKSTLLRAVAGLERLDAGRVSYAGADVGGIPTHRRGFAMMFQDGQLFQHASVGSNVGYALRLKGIGRRARAAEVDRLLALVGLDGYAARRPATRSGGEQQRVALARALAARPRLLRLDEPLAARDRAGRERRALDLRAVLVETGTTALLVTHDHDEAFTVADRTAIMRAGRLVQVGPTMQVWRHPADAETARFLGYDLVVHGAAARRLLAAAGLSQSTDSSVAPDGCGPTIAIRRDTLRVDDDGPLTGTVRLVAPSREGLRLQVDLTGIGEVPAVHPHTRPDAHSHDGVEAPWTPGHRVRLSVDPTDVVRL